MTESTWEREHGAEYRVPSFVTDHPSVSDESWHNDTCPRFVVDGGVEILADGSPVDVRYEVWCDHPDPAKRDGFADGRFFAFRVDADGDPVADTTQPYGADLDSPIFVADTEAELAVALAYFCRETCAHAVAMSDACETCGRLPS